jgi:uncharacterized protein (TIGR00661 family)
MARILYGISGDGFGHATRSKEVLTHLQASGHELLIVSYDKGYEMLAKSFRVKKINGLRLEYAHNEVKYLATVAKNIMKSKANIKSLDKVLSLAKKFKPDLVITDFEPTVTLAANWLNLPLISLDNMHVITQAKIEVPEKWRTNYLTTKLVIKLLVVHATKYLILSFFPVKTRSAKALIVPPILRQEILDLKTTSGKNILVYLTAADDSILPVLRASSAAYTIYGFNRSGREANLTFKKLGSKDYLADLASAKAIIATAGFSLLSEALYLSKPYLALPIKNQFEQTLNAYYLQKLGYGLMTEKLSATVLKNFLGKLPKFEKKLLNYKAQNNSAALAVLDKTIKELL